jgi:RNA polymerase sigma factor (sigma-70 family)
MGTAATFPYSIGGYRLGCWPSRLTRGYLGDPLIPPSSRRRPLVTSTSPDLEELFLTSLPIVDRIAAVQARRYRLQAADAEEFTAWARSRLVEDDYAVLRKFGGRSSLATYLTTVVVNLFRDFRNSRWGRWRPSAAALRLGPTAVRLECLLYRDGCSIHEAVQVLLGKPLGERELTALAGQLPVRAPVREISLNSDVGLAASGIADPSAGHELPNEDAAAVWRILTSSVEGLAAEDAVIVRMRFWDGLTVADIARALHLDQKSLYRQISMIQGRLRDQFVACGIDRATALDAIDDTSPA